MQNFQDTFEARKQSFISVFSICMTALLCYMLSVLFVCLSWKSTLKKKIRAVILVFT